MFAKIILYMCLQENVKYLVNLVLIVSTKPLYVHGVFFYKYPNQKPIDLGFKISYI